MWLSIQSNNRRKQYYSPARPRISLLSLLGTGEIIGTTTGDVDARAGFNLNDKPQVVGVSYLGESASPTLRLKLLARLGLRLGVRGVCEPGPAVMGFSIGAGIPAVSSRARRFDNSRVRRFMTASDSASSSCSIRILSALN